MPNTTCRVTVDGKDYVYPAGTPYGDIARSFRKDDDIFLASRDGVYRELRHTLDRDCTLTFLTARDKPGYKTYERSATFLMLKAFHDVAGRENVERITAEFSLSRGVFFRARGSFTLDAALLERVEARMRELSAADLPIDKAAMSTDDAIDLYRRAGMEDKARLLKYRIDSLVNVYTLDGFPDYFYGYMAPSTGYIRVFGLELYEDGFVLRLPDREDPSKLGAFTPAAKTFRALSDAAARGEAVGISTVADLNEFISKGRSDEVVLSAEAVMEKRVGDIAEKIIGRRHVRFVMIAGPSSSGKTTFSHRLCTQLRANGMIPHPIATDNYFVNRVDTPRDASGNYDFECLEAMDIRQLNEDMARLMNGERVELPRYNFIKGEREYNGNYLQLGEHDILVIEGIHCLNDALSYALPQESKFKIYISALTTLNVDHHNRIPTTEVRLLRRIERDARTRGHSAMATIKMWPSVRRGEENNIFPFQDSADEIFNSSMIYETSLLKPYIEPLLFDIPRDCPEYPEAKRLLKFLNYFLPITDDAVPKSSILREFIGGGCYQT